MSITLRHKSKAAAVHIQELWLLHKGLQRYTNEHAPINEYNQLHMSNIGYLVATAFTEIKTGPACTSKKMIVIGSLVTPIESFGIEVLCPITSERCPTMDIQYLGNCNILVPNYWSTASRIARLSTISLSGCWLPTRICYHERTWSLCLSLRSCTSIL